MWDGNITQKSSGFGINDGQVGVVALKGGEEGERDSIRGVEREGGWRVEVLDSGLQSVSLCMSIIMSIIMRPRKYIGTLLGRYIVAAPDLKWCHEQVQAKRRTPRYREDHFVTRGCVALDIVVVAVEAAMLNWVVTERRVVNSM
jgi:hypothetical protein